MKEFEKEDPQPRNLMTRSEFAQLGDGEVAYIKQLDPDAAERLFPALQTAPKGIDLFAVRRKRLPGLGFLIETLTARAGNRVDPRPPVVLGGGHLGSDVAAHLEPVQRGIQRALARLQPILRYLLQPAGDAPAVVGAELEDAQDHKVEGALQEL